MNKLNKRPFEEAQVEVVTLTVADIITASTEFKGDEDIFEEDA